jgi:hypothetical protein
MEEKLFPSNSLERNNPFLASQWHPTKNEKLSPSDITSGSGLKVWWKCNKGDDHVWQATVANRNNGQSCPFCSGHRVGYSNCLASTDPKLASQWHPSKNGELTPFDITPGSNKKVWWKCEKGPDHEWIASVNHRTNGNGCAVCSGQKVVLSNCLATTNPLLTFEWHPTKNGHLSPYNISSGSHTKVWWKCNKGDDHVWQATVANRNKGDKCPICRGFIVVLSNCLYTTHPELASEWHPTKNGKLTPLKVTYGYNKKVWWKCNKGDDHEWISSPNNRTSSNTSCPFCTLTPQSKQELIITHELITIFKDIDPKGFKINVKSKLRSIDIYIPKLKLGIEFDGNYWHKGKREMDKLKTKELESVGLNIIRVRQKPLKRIFDSDVMAEKSTMGK